MLAKALRRAKPEDVIVLNNEARRNMAALAARRIGLEGVEFRVEPPS